MPTVKLATTNAPVGAPAPTVPLKTGGMTAPGAPAAQPGAKTQPGELPGAPSALPKATVQLPSPTQPLTSPTQPLTAAGTAAGPNTQAGFRMQGADVAGPPTIVRVFAALGLAASIAVLGFQLKLAGIWIKVEDNPNGNSWEQLIEPIES